MPDYCENELDAYKLPMVKECIVLAANGDAHAEEFLWRFYNFQHAFDDLLDRDRPVTDELAIRELLLFVQTLTFNPFYARHRNQLFSLLVQLGATVVDCDEWLAKNKNPKASKIAGYFGLGDQEIMMHVAFLTGGWDHMRRLKSLPSFERFPKEY